MGKKMPDPNTVVADQPKRLSVVMWSEKYDQKNLELFTSRW